MAAPHWTADEWIAWLRRGPSDPLPARSGLNDCADALAENLAILRDRIAQFEAEPRQ